MPSLAADREEAEERAYNRSLERARYNTRLARWEGPLKTVRCPMKVTVLLAHGKTYRPKCELTEYTLAEDLRLQYYLPNPELNGREFLYGETGTIDIKKPKHVVIRKGSGRVDDYESWEDWCEGMDEEVVEYVDKAPPRKRGMLGKSAKMKKENERRRSGIWRRSWIRT
jgi:hypothetical protein